MNNMTTLNVCIATVVMTMGQGLSIPVSSNINPSSAYPYATDPGTNLTEAYHIISAEPSMEILALELAQRLITNSQDLPSEYNNLISEHFWDLV
jgi:hypothetical protein